MRSFKTVVEKSQSPASFTYANVPFDCVKEFGSHGQIKVNGNINGKLIKATLKPNHDRKHFIVLTRGIRVKCNIHVGDIINVSLQKEQVKDKISIPPELESLFKKNKDAAEYFESLPTIFKKQYLTWIEEAKLESTRKKRIEQTERKLLKQERLKERVLIKKI